MSDLLGLGSSAVSAYRSALNAIGENVANSETIGYSRREVRLQELGGGSGRSPIYREQNEFNGVRAGEVTRAWDMFRAADARLGAAAAGRATARETWLTAVETALDDGPAGAGSTIGRFFNAGVSLAANPDDALGRRAMLMALDDAAGAIRTTAGSLARVAEGLQASAQLEVDGLNSDLAALADINRALRQANPGTTTRASLEDERDRLLDGVAARIGIDVKLDKQGIATVSLQGASDTRLVEGNSAASVSLATAADGRLSLKLLSQGTITPLPVSGGSLAGLVDVADATAARRSELDAIATSFAVSVNAWSAAGRTGDGNPGAPLVEAPAGAASLRLLTSDPAAIAAASTDGTANGNLLALSGLRGGDGAETRWGALVAGNALILSSARSEASAATSRRDNSFGARDEITGVDLDYEAAELMRFQQAYGGATRIIQVARETMQSILDLF